MTDNYGKYSGLSENDALKNIEKYGENLLTPKVKANFFLKLLSILKEPMFLLLIAAAIVYFILGEPRDGAIMLVFVLATIAVDVIQEWKTDKTLKALQDLSAPKVTVIREGVKKEICAEYLTVDDVYLISEGEKIAADGEILEFSDLSVDESTLTGETVAVWKTLNNTSKDYWQTNLVYAGTLVVCGSAVIKVTKIGKATEYGKIGSSIAEETESKTPLQKQTGKLVSLCAKIALVLFLAVAVITFFNEPSDNLKQRIIASVLSGITLAMAMIPEEFPVVLTVFLSMGAWRLAKKNALIKRLPAVETLGAVTALCVDKTGTITQNKMQVKRLVGKNERTLISALSSASEENAYDAMEKAILLKAQEFGVDKAEYFGGKLIKEYSFTDALKMMGHVYEKDGVATAYVKGSPESVISICNLTQKEKEEALKDAEKLAANGLRVLACGREVFLDNVKEDILQCNLEYLGLVALYDPPKEGIEKDVARAQQAGIRVIMITGDNGVTASSIAKAVGIKNSQSFVTGKEIEAMSEEELREKVKSVNVFSRVLPSHKKRIVKALKSNGEVVAMTGDGVNDAAALKAADIGVAMGKRGSEVSREAADMVLLDDNFGTIIDTCFDGRRIYDNIRRAIGYIFSIHIPIALISLIAPLLKIPSDFLMLLPLHVVLLELIIDPTCSIVLERQKAEKDIEIRAPRSASEKILDKNTLIKSVVLGFTIFLASFGIYYLVMNKIDEVHGRTMGLAVLFLSNILLVYANASKYGTMAEAIWDLRKDKVMWISVLGIIAMLAIIVYTPVNTYLKLTALKFTELLIALGLSFIAVCWYELFKVIRNKVIANRKKRT